MQFQKTFLAVINIPINLIGTLCIVSVLFCHLLPLDSSDNSQKNNIDVIACQ